MPESKIKLLDKKEVCMRHSVTVLLLLSLSFLARDLKAQTSQGLVTVSLNVPQYNQIYVADLDIKHMKSSGVLFTAMVTSNSSQTIQVKLYLEIDITLPGQAPFQIAWARSAPITLLPNQSRSITNVDLSGSNPTISLEDSWYDQQEFDKIRNVALATGKVPAGTYTFKLQCLDLNNQPLVGTQTHDEGDIIVTNPTRVDLQTPADQSTVSTVNPIFLWTASSDTVTLSVYQQEEPGQGSEDAVTGIPFLKQNVSGSSFIYPPSGAGIRPLQNGRTYFWYVQLPSSSTLGAGAKSNIWRFTVSSSTGASDTSSQSNNSQNVNDAATRALQNLLNGTSYQSLINQINMLNGSAMLDGKSIDTQQLIEILQSMDKSKITNVTTQ